MLPLAMGVISGKDEIAQFVALADCHKANGRPRLDAQARDGEQPLQEHVGFLNGEVRAGAAMVPITKAHQHRGNVIALDSPPWAEVQGMLANNASLALAA